jgi:competence protein ComEC
MARAGLAGASAAFAAGIALGAWLPQRPGAACTVAGGAVLLWAIARRAARARRGPGLASRAAAPAAWLAIMLVGLARAQVDLGEVYHPALVPPDGEGIVAGRVEAPGRVRGSDMVLTLDDASFVADGEERRAVGAVQLQVIAGAGERFEAGELIAARARLSPPRADTNVGWFPAPAGPAGGGTAARGVVVSPRVVRREGRIGGGGPAATVLRWREAASGFWRASPGPASALSDALTTGERVEIGQEVQAAFFRSGLTHLIAISGMNVGCLVALVYFLLRRAIAALEPLVLRIPAQPLAAAATLPFLWFFYRFSGSQIPVGRAVLMAAAALLAVILWRRGDAVNALGIAALVYLALDPRSLFSVSFQLSFAAVTALVLVAPRVARRRGEHERRCERLARTVRNLLLVSAAAGGMTAPLVAFHFQQVALVGPLANLVAVPYTEVLALPAAWAAILGDAIWVRLGEWLRPVAVALASGLIVIADFFATPAWSSVRTARPPPLVTLAVTAVVASLLPPGTPRLRRARLFALVAAVVSVALWIGGLHAAALRVAVFDVGQGLSAAALLPGGGVLVVDGGPRWRSGDAGSRIVAPALRALGVRRIDALAITHLHPDHAGGVPALLAEFPVAKVWHGLGAVEESGLAAVLAPWGRPPSGAERLTRGEERELPGEVRVRVLNPPAAAAPGRLREAGANDRSLGLLLTWRRTGVVVLGDAGADVVPGMAAAAAGRVPPGVVLQVPHHGGSPSACRAAVEAFGPAVAVIPVGRNGYGHPRPAAVAALEASARVLRTDRDGAVFVTSDGERLEVRTWREMAACRSWPERVRWLTSGW